MTNPKATNTCLYLDRERDGDWLRGELEGMRLNLAAPATRAECSATG